MYLTLSWQSLNGTPADAIEGEIIAAFGVLKFADFFTPYDGLFVASVLKNETQKQVQLLSNALNAATHAPGRYSFVISVSPNSQALWLSADLADPAFGRIAKYVT